MKEQKPDRAPLIHMEGASHGNKFIGIQSDTDRPLLRTQEKDGNAPSNNSFEDIKLKQKTTPPPNKSWWEKPLGIFSLTVAAGLVVAYAAYLLGLV